ncbi:MAG TPA: peptidoglycan bridge formation glycyltransferase FemA/FemB family protein, partial [Treponemataceae bacterium]|nr:peptidoglycan bridge formation glycyltransferase FemA/FemB family protein [Treponemataceae bacterium]
SEHIDYFYDLFKETAERDRIATHSKSYYKSLLELSENKTANDINKKDVQVRLYVAHAPLENGDAGEALAAIIVLFAKGGQAVYLYGASSNKKRNLMPAYLLQWTAIQDAKQFDCISYDFYGIPPTNNKDHPMHGLWRFKTGFGGKNIHRLGSIDLPLSRWYYIYIKLEKIRTWYYKVFKKIS